MKGIISQRTTKIFDQKFRLRWIGKNDKFWIANLKKFYSANLKNAIVISGSCGCGTCGWSAHGPSSLNYICHCNACREASGKKALISVGFKPSEVKWKNPSALVEKKYENSKVSRFYCKNCNEYVGGDATHGLGILTLPLHLSSSIPDCYKPNHHIFYKHRIEEAHDPLPKWEEFIDGNIHLSVKQSQSETNQNIQPMKSNLEDQLINLASSYSKDYSPLSPLRPPAPLTYQFTESDPPINLTTKISQQKLDERITRKYYTPSLEYQKQKTSSLPKKKDVVIIGGGHNGLVAAAYLAKAGLDVLVLERREFVGGAAITEELYPGFKFSRASYLAGLFRPQIIKDLELEKYGFKYIPRNPSSFTPSKVDGPYGGKSLFFWDDEKKTKDSIAQFSVRDSERFAEYESFLGKMREVVTPLLDGPPPDFTFRQGNAKERKRNRQQIWELVKLGLKHRTELSSFYELFTAPASQILDRWFESEILKTTLATDAVIGSLSPPSHAGSAYVLLHHVMGEAAGKKGVWAYVQGGMGALTQSISKSAKNLGAEIVEGCVVKKILHQDEGFKKKAVGVLLEDGTEIRAKVVLSNATPYHTFLELLPGLAEDSSVVGPLPKDFQQKIRFADYTCGALKINCAVSSLPNFTSLPNDPSGASSPQHHGTIHFENFMEELENAAREAVLGIPATRPVIEMTIPSALDPTVAPPGKHVVQLFIQFAPYNVDPKIGSWADPDFKNRFADRCFSIIDEFAPGFSSSVLYRDILSPLDLEYLLALHKGNIMHGALSLHQLAYTRPTPNWERYRTPLDGLYLCGAGAHPGGGVMGAAGRNCAFQVLSDLEK